MIRLSQLVLKNGIFLDVEAQTQVGVLERITGCLVEAGIVDRDDQSELLTRLTEREKLCSTAVGHGAAIPHAYFDKLKTPMVVVCRTQQPIDFCAPDGDRVDLIFVLLGPKRVPAQHIQILSRIARMLKDEQFDNQLRHAHEPDEVLAALQDVEKRHH
ncbi:MAG: PTS sugar transporter subunit IIA [Candidatus Lernaella stagnicola]|nr:PTS sugar transporter subunit IIA [Candidatus Lernaella stagnicola]